MSRGLCRRWMGLLVGLALMGLGVLALHHASASVSAVMALSQARGMESDAYFYTEVDDLQAFLDDDGRYGGKPLEAE